MTVTVDSERMARDVFPAEVVMPDGSVLRNVRVFVTSHRMRAFGVVDGKINVVASLELSEPGSVPADRNSLGVNGRLEIRTAVGTAWVNRGRGCGCGSPLRGLEPPISWQGTYQPGVTR